MYSLDKNHCSKRKIGKKIKIIAKPNNIEDARKFIGAIISPFTFKNIEFNGNEIVITAGMQSKAALIGRNRIREQELESVLQKFFGVEKVRIV